MVLKCILSLKQNHLQKEHENNHNAAYMSWQCLHKISDFLKIFFNIKNLWNQSILRENMKFSGSTDLQN